MKARDFKHKKRYGQNFLGSTKHVLALLEAIELSNKDRILEIGPGMGAITDFLPMNCEFVLAIDIDPELIEILSEKYEHVSNLEIMESDVLEVSPAHLLAENNLNKVVGALPYNISKLIIDRFCSNPQINIELAGFILQKEVAHDYAGIGNKNSFLHTYYSAINEIILVDDIEKSVFKPEPKVDSSSIVFKRRPESQYLVSKEQLDSYRKFLKNAFRNPRKKLSKNLKNIYKEYNWDLVYSKLNLEDNIRVEQLTNQQLIDLFHEFLAQKDN